MTKKELIQFFFEALYSRWNFTHENGEYIDKPWDTEIERVYLIGEYIDKKHPDDEKKWNIKGWVDSLAETFINEAWLEEDDVKRFLEALVSDYNDCQEDLDDIFRDSIQAYLETYGD